MASPTCFLRARSAFSPLHSHLLPIDLEDNVILVDDSSLVEVKEELSVVDGAQISEEPSPEPPKTHSSRKASSRATLFNIINLYVGLGLLAQSYALRQGGWMALPLMGICCLFSLYTGKVVVRCFQRLKVLGFSEENANWATLANFVWNRWTKWVLFGLALTELCGAGCMAMLMLWKNLEGLFPHLNKLYIELGTLLCVVPCLFANGFGELTFVSVLGVLSKAVTTLLPVVLYFTSNEGTMPQHSEHEILSLPTLPISFAIIILSYSAHVALPSIYMSMETPADFDRVLNISFFLMFLLYVTIGTFGYLNWGTLCSPLITYDATLSISEGWQYIFTEAVSYLVAWSIYATIVPIMSVTAGTISGSISCWQGGASRLATRLGLLASIGAICHVLGGQLGYVEEMLGVISALFSLFIPMAFYLKLFGPEMGRWVKLRSFCLLLCSGVCVLLVTTTGILSAVHRSDDASN